MRKGLAILVFLCTILCESYAYDFNFYWPVIKSGLNASTSGIAFCSNTATWSSNQVVVINGLTNGWQQTYLYALTNGGVTGGLLTWTRTGKVFSIGLTTNAVTNAIVQSGLLTGLTNSAAASWAWIQANSNAVWTMTNNWPWVTSTVSWTSNGYVNLSNSWFGSTAYRIDYLATQAWWQATVNSSAFTNWLATNTYIKVETDPVWTNWLSTNGLFAVWNQSALDSTYMTNWLATNVFATSDPAFTNWLATNTYIKVELDTVFTNWLATNPPMSDVAWTNWLATNTWVKFETDPVFTNWFATNTWFSSWWEGWTNASWATNWIATNTLYGSSTDTLQQVVNRGNSATNVGALTAVADWDMDVYGISGTRFGPSAGSGASGNYNSYIGQSAGIFAVGDYNNHFGNNAGSYASGNNNYYVGYFAGSTAVSTNCVYIGEYAGNNARGTNRMYMAVYRSDPSYPAGAATNDCYFQDTDGKLFLGFGASALLGMANAGGVLRGNWNLGTGSASTLSGCPAGAVSTNDANYLGALTGLVYGAQAGITISGRTATLGTNNFGGSSSGGGADAATTNIFLDFNTHTNLPSTWATNVQRLGEIGSATNTVTNTLDFSSGLAVEYTYTNNVWLKLTPWGNTNAMVDAWVIATHESGSVYTEYEYTNAGTFIWTNLVSSVCDVLMVGGGGAGGESYNGGGSGGGGGGGIMFTQNVSLLAGNYTIFIDSNQTTGGQGLRGNPGLDTTFTGLITARGGGGGAGGAVAQRTGGDGASGGGGGTGGNGGTNIVAGQGYNGGSSVASGKYGAGGGGGAGSLGTNGTTTVGGMGGAGRTIWGITYGGGGGGGTYGGGTPGVGGSGGGGNGSEDAVGGAGTPGLGGGGGGAGDAVTTGGSGGSGCVKIREYSIGVYTHTIVGGNVKFPSGTVPTLTQGSGAKDYLNFISSGTNWVYRGGILNAQ